MTKAKTTKRAFGAISVAAMMLMMSAGTIGCGPKPAPKNSATSTPTTSRGAATGTATVANARTPVARHSRIAFDSAIEIEARDPRPASHHPRPRALLLTETSSLASTESMTPATSADAPALVRRLAEDYAELARASDSRPDQRSAHARAIKTYEYLLQAFPTYAKKDEVLYNLGLEYELMGVSEEAARCYKEVARVGSAKLPALAQFGLGEIALRESARDPAEINDAIAAYSRAIDASTPADKIFAESLARTAEAYERAGDHGKATVARDRVMKEFGSSDAAMRAQKARSSAQR